MEEEDPFALYLSIVPLCSIYKVSINTRIVVVGSSNTAMAFLESLLLKQEINYQVIEVRQIT